MGNTSSSIFSFSTRLIATAFEDFRYPWGVQHSMYFLLDLLHRCHILLGVKKVLKNTVTVTVATQIFMQGTTVDTQTPAKGPEATSTPTRVPAATHTPMIGIAAEPENQPVPVSVAPIQKKKCKKKNQECNSEDEPGSSQEEEQEATT